jgi:DNA-binding NarL/FixJ family response regulator
MADMDQEQSRIAVLILDDQLIQREGVARVVEVTGTMRVAGAVGTAEEAFQLLRAAPIDLALVDLVLRGSRGIDVGRAMRRLRPELKVIIYTREKSMVVAAEILRERKDLAQPGLQGYILTRNISDSHYVQEVYDQVLEQGHYIDPDVLRWHYRFAEIEGLTPREEECALLVAKGLGNHEIARRMVISHRRVESLVNALYLKFHVLGDPGDPGRRVLLAEGVRLLYGHRVQSQTFNVLLVEDHADVRARLRQALEEDGRLHIVGEAGDGRQAVDLANKLKPDVVLVDMHLPDGDGFQITRRILDAHPHVKVIMQSAEAGPTYEDAARRAGALALLAKSRLTADAIVELCSDA